MGKTLIVLESPGKVKKVQGFLGSSYVVKASVGHIMNLEKGNKAIDKENGFEPTYVVSEDKKDVVKELKELYKKCDDVILLTDMDLEGEKIAHDVCIVLGLKPEKTKRGVTAEITEKGIKKAIENPGFINMNKVFAQQGRRVIDRLVGYDLSPLLWNKIQKGLSAGRVQSVATRIIVEREKEISDFETGSDFKVVGLFEAKDKKNKIHSFKGILNKRYKNKKDVQSFLEKCIGAGYTIKNLETKVGKKSPSAPFTTSTIQQESSRKFGYAVDKTMQILQKIYENGHCTYMRTDSVTMSQEALDAAKAQIITAYGKNYSNPKQYQTKAANAAEAHECIRPTHFETPSIDGTDEEKRLYELIWKRTLASQMSEAIFDRTTVTIESDKVKEEFVAKGEVLKFDGFLKLYVESTDNENEDEESESAALPEMSKGQSLNCAEIEGKEIFSKPSARYTQATLVKRMEELGVGRPSTYASTIKTIVDRGYVETKNLPAKKRDIATLKLVGQKIDESVRTENFGAEKSKIFPTDIGRVVTDYLVANFPIILDYKFTASVESELDEIEGGKKVWSKMVKEFYDPFSETLKEAKGSTDRPGARLVGVDPISGKNVYSRIGRFGPMIQLGESVKQEKGVEKEKGDVKFAKLPEGLSIETITLKECLGLLSWPKLLGEHKKLPVEVNEGKYGPFVKYNSKFYSISLPKETITLEEAVEIIKAKDSGESTGALAKFGEISVLKGRYGPYIRYKNNNFKIPADIDAEAITKEQCEEIVGDGKKKATTYKKLVKKKSK